MAPARTLSMDLINEDCRTALRGLRDSSVDAIVTDPPAGIAFMKQDWDDFRRRKNPNDACRPNVFGRTSKTGPEYGRGDRAAFIAFIAYVMSECFRIAKPGARCLVWAIPRTSHWTATGIEDAGWVIEDRIAHLQAQGFPKGRTRLKPACEDWWLARKPAKRVPPLNIDACRIPIADKGEYQANCPGDRGHARNRKRQSQFAMTAGKASAGRYPANVTHDGSDEVLAAFAHAGERPSGTTRLSRRKADKFRNTYGAFRGSPQETVVGYADGGSAARFFFCSKASRTERNAGLDQLQEMPLLWSNGKKNPSSFQSQGIKRASRNHHPTVKPITLMRWLCRLITPPGGVVLDPFMGSGSTALACAREGFDFIGIERDPSYFEIAQRRIVATMR